METTHRYAHLVVAAEAFASGTLALGDTFETPSGGRKANRWVVTAADDGETVFAPQKGGRCYPVAYCLGEGRVAIERTAAMVAR